MTQPDRTTTMSSGLCLYYYFMDRDLGLIHVCVQTWFPLQIQVPQWPRVARPQADGARHSLHQNTALVRTRTERKYRVGD